MPVWSAVVIEAAHFEILMFRFFYFQYVYLAMKGFYSINLAASLSSKKTHQNIYSRKVVLIVLSYIAERKFITPSSTYMKQLRTVNLSTVEAQYKNKVRSLMSK